MLAAAQQQAGWALTRLYEALAPAVAGYLRAQGVREVEDVTNEVFIAVLTGARTFSGDEAQFRSWVFTIAHRRVVDARRARERSPGVDSLDAGPIDGPQTWRSSVSAEDIALQRLGTERVERLLGALTPEQRDVLALRILGDLSVEDVAAAVGKPPGAVKALQRRALAALRRRLSRGIGGAS
ncbi:MAG: sigma-70 family RNA polymerase sigma factor [Actinomycetota bacterium]|nr:sigma-70 family RNA polymerase sigma factor [Actinomycetota bacterium]